MGGRDGQEALHRSRRFGEGQGAILLDIESDVSLDRFVVRLTGRSVPHPTKEAVIVDGWQAPATGKVETVPALGRPEGEIYPTWSSNADMSVYSVEFALDRAQLDGFGKAPMTLSAAHQAPIALRVPPLATTLTVLEGCVKDNYKAWGVDMARIEAAVRQPQPRENPGRWFKDTDLPAAVVGTDGKRETVIALDLDATGKPEDCRILVGSGIGAFDTAACGSLKMRGKFNPARDAAGEAIPSTYVTKAMYENVKG